MWLGHLKHMTLRYKDDPFVAAYDLRNELRRVFKKDGSILTPTWGTGDPATDWAEAASKAANQVRGLNPDMLLIVEGLDFALDLTKVNDRPLHLDPIGLNKLVYSVHSYSWSETNGANFNSLMLATYLDKKWGYFMANEKDKVAPIWVGEFGINEDGRKNLPWWKSLMDYFKSRPIAGWSYWAIDGEKEMGQDESFGIFKQDYNTIRLPGVLLDIETAEPPEGIQGKMIKKDFGRVGMRRNIVDAFEWEAPPASPPPPQSSSWNGKESGFEWCFW